MKKFFSLFLTFIIAISCLTNFNVMGIGTCTHTWGEWQKSVYNCEDGGDEWRQCQQCYDMEYREVPGTSHKWGAWDIDIYLCDVTNYKYRECVVCGETDTATVEPNEHTYTTVVSKDGEFIKGCTKCIEEDYSFGETIVIKLSSTKYIENGKNHRPKVTVGYQEYGEDKIYKKISKSNYTVSYSGKGKKIGTYKVTVKFKNKYSGKLTKKYKVVKNSINKKSLKLYKGKTYKLKLAYNKGKIKWTSSNKKIATVSSKGKVTAKKPGKCVITAKYLGKKYTCKITVKKKKTKTPVSTGQSSGASYGTQTQSPSYSSGGTVWIPQSGSKYHSYSGCSGMNGPSKVSRSEAESMGYAPCARCW